MCWGAISATAYYIQVSKTGTYEGFSFFYFTHNNSAQNILDMEAIGVSGSFSFGVYVFNMPLSNYIPLIHDEIQAMTE